MNISKSYQFLLLLILSLVLSVSCEIANQEAGTQVSSTNTLRINFHDNIISTHPLEAHSDSEQFVARLVYERLFKPDGSSNLIKSYAYDSTQSKYTFSMPSGKQFHDGTELNSGAIKAHLKYLFENHFEDPEVRKLYFSLKGSGATNWYRQNRNILDSIPNGFQILNDSVFSIELKIKNFELIENFKSQLFTIFKIADEKIIGNGPFELIALNEDISAQLGRVSKSEGKIDVINLSFIKNENVVFNEFLNGSLDIITYNEIKNPILAKNEKLQDMLEDKYPTFQVVNCNPKIIRYAVFYNIEDSATISQILQSVNYKTDSMNYWRTSNVSSLPMLETFDTLIKEVQVRNMIDIKTNLYFESSADLKYKATNSENINPSLPHIVIMETDVDNSWPNLEMLRKFEEQLTTPNTKISAIIELERIYTYVIFSNKLKDYSERTNLSEMVSNMYYSTPKVY